MSNSVPFEPQTPPSTSTSTLLNTTVVVNATGHTLFDMNNSSFRGDYNNPILLQLANASSSSLLLSSPNPDLNIYNHNGDATVRLVLVNPDPPSHPIHLHGHDFFILAEGIGTWNGSIAKPRNPARKDTHMIPGGTPEQPAYLVIEIAAVNPGAWAYHCHVAW